MFNPDVVTVQVTFRPPNRSGDFEESELHERALGSVPKAVAQTMVEDLSSYRKGTAPRYQVYKYASGPSDEEVLVALDLGEVVDLRVQAQVSLRFLRSVSDWGMPPIRHTERFRFAFSHRADVVTDSDLRERPKNDGS